MDNNTFFERSGAILIIICVLALIGLLGYSFCLTKTGNIQAVTVDIVMPVDSAGVLSGISQQSIESLKEELVRHEQLLEDRYKHILEQKENMNDLWSVGGMFLAVVLAMFGFFGYKSISSIEDKVLKDAQSIAEKTAENVSKKKLEVMEKEVHADMQRNMKESVGKSVAQQKVKMKRVIDDTIQTKLKDSIQQVADFSQKVDDLTTSIDNMSQNVTKLSERVNLLETQKELLKRGRRTLDSGWKER